MLSDNCESHKEYNMELSVELKKRDKYTEKSKVDVSLDLDCRIILNKLNDLTKRKYSGLKEIRTALKAGYTKEQLLMVLSYKYDEWNESDIMSKYIRPSTLFSRINIDRYIEEMDNEGER